MPQSHHHRHRVRVRVAGELGPALAAVFADMRVASPGDATTVITGEVADDAGVHGLLARIRDLGLSIIEVESNVLASPGPEAPPPDASPSALRPTHGGSQ